MRCEVCTGEMPRRGGYIVIASDIENGIGLAVIKAEVADPDAVGERVCGLLCLNLHTSKKFGELAGVKPLFPTEVAL